MKAYLATFFFDYFGFEGTKRLAAEIRLNIPGIDLYVPQENASINSKKDNDSNITTETIYVADRDRLLNSDILIACIDGVEIDSGVSGEIGMLAGFQEALIKYGIPHKPKKIILFYSDMRQDGLGDNHMYKNLFTKGAGEHFGVTVRTVQDIICEIKKFENQLINI